jgi:hypothetical protein
LLLLSGSGGRTKSERVAVEVGKGLDNVGVVPDEVVVDGDTGAIDGVSFLEADVAGPEDLAGTDLGGELNSEALVTARVADPEEDYSKEGDLVTISPVARRAGILLGEPSWCLLGLQWCILP